MKMIQKEVELQTYIDKHSNVLYTTDGHITSCVKTVNLELF